MGVAVNVARRTVLLVAAVLVWGMLAPAATADPQPRVAPAGPVVTEFPAPVPVVDGWYGNSVAIDGDRFLVGAPYDDMVIDNTTYYAVGSVWLYTWSGSTWAGTEFRPPY